MATLTIKDFGCVKHAKISLSQMTVLIGPQASGKSLISKLLYFFYDLLEEQFRSIEEREDLEAFSTRVSAQFKNWFPIGAWGNRKFTIEFLAGPYQVKIARKIYRGEVRDDLRIVFSEYFEEQFERAAQSFSRADPTGDFSALTASQLDVNSMYRIRRRTLEKIRADLGADAILGQTFIPAGRSFFTTVGKAMAAFEHIGLLDPLTVRFGRLFTLLRDRGLNIGPRSDQEAEIADVMRKLFGGELKFGRDKDFLLTRDGRKIPFSYLSSGQQELLPLWAILHVMIQGNTRDLTYIEEPEAHLFPTSQGYLVEVLCSLVTNAANPHRMLITTHSPYVLSKLNNLLKAGQLASQIGKTQSNKLAAIVRRELWLPPGSVRAYAIKDQTVRNIIDKEGLIDGDYLDEVSGDIAREFNSLLDLEPDA